MTDVDQRRPRRPGTTTAPRPRGPLSRVSLARMDTAQLWDLRHTGDPAAREELARRFLPLARKLAFRYKSSAEAMDDLLQVASLGLVEAIERFEPARGHGFAAFAVPTILGELKRYFRDTGWAVHVPRGAKELALEVTAAARKMTTELGRSPRVTELARYMERDIDDILLGLDGGRARYAMSLETPVSADDTDEARLSDGLGVDEDGYGLVDATAVLSDGIRRLPFLERRVLMMRVTENLTQAEIARRLGCSQMQVSRLMRRGADRLRDGLEPARRPG